MDNSDTRPPYRIGLALGLILVLNFFLPKGGFYAGGVPLTWGYLALIPAAVWGTISLFFHGHLTMGRVIAYACSLPFIGLAVLTIISNGAQETSFAVALMVTFGGLPLILYIALDNYLPRQTIEILSRFVAAGFFLVAVWGIIGFVFTAITKTPPDIPFITTGGGSGLSTTDRDNWRGALYKLTATFNNGNIYGICALMLLPMVAQFLPRWKSNTVKLSILLTLSRSAWAGLVFYELGHAIFVRRRAGTLKYLFAAFVIVALLLSLLLYFLGTDTSFLLSANLGGRLHTYQDIGEILPFSTRTFESIDEIVYPSILSSFGYLGLAAFLLTMLAPFWLRYLDPRPYDDLDRAIMLGMLDYLMICWADGALLYIPSMLFYLALATSLLAIPRKKKAVIPLQANCPQQASS